jgi:hypothetical protein
MRVYTTTMNAVSVSTGKTLIRITTPATMVACLLRAWISQNASATSQQARATIHRVTTDGTGTTDTPEKSMPGDPAATVTAAVDFTAEPTTSGDPVIDEGFNVLNGWLWVPAPEDRLWVPPSARIALRLPNSPSPAITISAGLVFGEVG